jgi:hypothetical protein
LLRFTSIKGFMRGIIFISMAIEVHDTPKRDMGRFIKKCVHRFQDRWLGDHLSLSFCIQFFKQCVNIAF